MIFFFVALVGMYVGRRFGWWLSKQILYPAPIAVTVLGCLAWAALVAFGVYTLIRWRQPHIINRIIMGYALGSYVSVPNFGLFDESTLPRQWMRRNQLIMFLPAGFYVVALVALTLIAK